MGVDLDRVWNVIANDLPLLRRTVDQMLSDITASGCLMRLVVSHDVQGVASGNACRGISRRPLSKCHCDSHNQSRRASPLIRSFTPRARASQRSRVGEKGLSLQELVRHSPFAFPGPGRPRGYRQTLLLRHAEALVGGAPYSQGTGVKAAIARGALLDGRTTHLQRALSPADAQPLALK